MNKQRELNLRWSISSLSTVCVLAYVAALANLGTLPYVLGLALAAVVVAALSDAQIGLFAGLGAAAAIVAVQRIAGAWTTALFGLHLLTAALIVAAALFAGRAGAVLRSVSDQAATAADHGPVFGSMGLIDEKSARTQIDGEIRRARLHDRPLSLMLVHVRVHPDTDAEVRRTAQRTVIRLIESLLRPTDVPFAFSAHQFGVVLPETDRLSAWHAAAPMLDAIAHASLPGEGIRERMPLREVAAITTVFAQLDDTIVRSSDLIAAALAALEEQSGASGVTSG